MSEKASSSIAKRRAAALQESGPEYTAKRQELIRVAAEIFRDKGFAATTLLDVATKLGTDRATLYYYVASKEELFQECLTKTVVLNLERAEEIAAKGLSPRETLLELITMVIESQAEHYPYVFLYMQEDIARAAANKAKWAETMLEHTHRLEKYFLDAIAAGIKDGSFRPNLSVTLTANSIFGMTQWTHRWWVPGTSRYSAADLVREFSTIFFEGIDAPETP